MGISRVVINAPSDLLSQLTRKNFRIVDLHSHIGVSPSPGLRGTSDGNSHNGPILPVCPLFVPVQLTPPLKVPQWLRALDALNTHSDAYALSISGGVTTSLVLPGSANAIGKITPFGVRYPMLTLWPRWTRHRDQTAADRGTFPHCYAS